MDRNMIKSIFPILQVCVLCCLMFLYGSVNASAAVERLNLSCKRKRRKGCIERSQYGLA